MLLWAVWTLVFLLSLGSWLLGFLDRSLIPSHVGPACSETFKKPLICFLKSHIEMFHVTQKLHSWVTAPKWQTNVHIRTQTPVLSSSDHQSKRAKIHMLSLWWVETTVVQPYSGALEGWNKGARAHTHYNLAKLKTALWDERRWSKSSHTAWFQMEETSRKGRRRLVVTWDRDWGLGMISQEQEVINKF